MGRSIIQVNVIAQRILLIRGEKMILDTDLADFYGITTKRLNEQVKRNRKRFPSDFMFQLTGEEKTEVVAKCDHLAKLKYSSTMPYAFTEHGALMITSVLNTARAVEVSLFVVRAFVKLRRTLVEHKELSKRLSLLEKRLSAHDQQIMAIVETIKKLLGPDPVPKKRQIGFKSYEP